MEAPDMVVPVRVGAANEQLRFALRSWAAHLPHRRVWLVGHRPVWATHVGHLPTEQTGSKFQNTTTAVRLACEHPEVSDPFLLANDDMFVMKEQRDGMPVLHRGLVADVEPYYAALGSTAYLRGLRETRDLLAELGEPDPLSYELHVPMPVDKVGMLAALDLGRHLDVLHKRTLYGNLVGLGGEGIADVKVMVRSPAFPRDGAFLSTMPDSFANGFAGRFIRDAFPLPSPYERKGR